MLEHAQAAGVLHFLNFERRSQPCYVALHRLVEQGAIGQLRHIQWTAFTSGSRTPLRSHGWLFDRDAGGGWIGAFGSHTIDAIRWLGGEVTGVEGRGRIDIGARPDREGELHPSTAEDAFTASLRLESGATAIIDTAFAAPISLPIRVTLIGDAGVAGS